MNKLLKAMILMATIQFFMASAMNKECTPACPVHRIPMIELTAYHLASALITRPCQAHINMLQHLTRGTRNPYFPPAGEPKQHIPKNSTPTEDIPTFNLQEFLNENNENNPNAAQRFLDYLKNLF